MPKILAIPGGGADVSAPVAGTNGSLAKFTGAATIGNGDLTGDVTTAGTTAATVVKVNGAAVPTSANVLGSNASNQLTASTAHNISVPLTAVAASASGTAYTATTTPTFVPADGDAILFEADVANTGAATLNLNASSAASIKKQGGGTALVANDLLAGQNVLLIYDGTNWQMQGQSGNVAGITNAAGNNVIPKSNGTNLVASALTDNGTTISSSESINLSSGTVISINSDVGISRNGPGAAIDFGNGTAGDTSATVRALSYIASSGGSFQLGSFGQYTGVNSSTRWVYNNGTIAGTSASLTLDGKITNYNAINTVDNGVPSELGHLDLTAQNAAIAATTIYTPTATGRFRISVYEKVTTAASVSSILGGSTGTVLTYTDGTDSVAQSISMGLDSQAGVIGLTNNANTTGTSLNGSAYIYAKTGVAIQIAIGYTSVNSGEMVFAVRATCEAL
jgi:hypothetical protein